MSNKLKSGKILNILIDTYITNLVQEGDTEEATYFLNKIDKLLGDIEVRPKEVLNELLDTLEEVSLLNKLCAECYRELSVKYWLEDRGEAWGEPSTEEMCCYHCDNCDKYDNYIFLILIQY